MSTLYSYVVAYDSGFAPNPFNGFCTLATCKPRIRGSATLGDWIIGTGSNRQGVRRGEFLVYAMRVQQILTFNEYWSDPRFQKKKPSLYGSYRMACGDNLYHKESINTNWQQLNSFHSNENGAPHQGHIERDTSVDRVLVSNDFVYFGAEGPKIPEELQSAELIHTGIGEHRITNARVIADFEAWIERLDVQGYQGRPFDMIHP